MSSPSDAWYLLHLFYHVACKGASLSSQTRTSTHKVLVSIPEVHGFYLTFHPSIYIDVWISFNALSMEKTEQSWSSSLRKRNQSCMLRFVYCLGLCSHMLYLVFFGQEKSVKCELNVDMKSSIIEPIVYLLI